MILEQEYNANNECTLVNDDCFNLLNDMKDESVDLIVSSPPYCIGKSYESPMDDLETFIQLHEQLFPELFRVLKQGGSLCWQVGYYSDDVEVTPLDFIIYDIVKNKLEGAISDDLILRNRIIWTFGHGLNATKKFSGRHETALWFTKGEDYLFDLDSVRIPQKYPGKKYYKGLKKGEYSCNPKGKNPSDVWDIPNVKANHVEKTDHPCQFPLSLPSRFIRALTSAGDVVFDPFMGVGTTGAAAVMLGRRFVGAEINEQYHAIACERVRDSYMGMMRFRDDVPVMEPDKKTAVARRPKEFDLNG